jgi:opacity protein-like surface antigen
MRTTLVTAGALVLMAVWFPLPAAAQNFELTPFAGYTWGGEFSDAVTGDTLKVDENNDYGLMIDFRSDDRAQYELYLCRQSTSLKSSQVLTGSPHFDLDIVYIHIGGTYTEAEGPVMPYVAGGLGVTHMVPKGPGLSTETKFSISIGGGVKFYATDHIGLRLEGRWFGTLFNGSGSVFCASGGGAVCAINVQGDLFSQFVANAGVILAF